MQNKSIENMGKADIGLLFLVVREMLYHEV
jgi:hypothetical protein